jgi:hypothetical protein
MARLAACGWLIGLVLGSAAATPPAEQTPSTEPPPSAELLQFLGEFADADGQFIDPTEIDPDSARATAAPPRAARNPKHPPATDREPEHDPPDRRHP